MPNLDENRKTWLRQRAASVPTREPITPARRAWLRARAADYRSPGRPAAAATPGIAHPTALILTVAAIVGAVGMLVGF